MLTCMLCILRMHPHHAGGCTFSSRSPCTSCGSRQCVWCVVAAAMRGARRRHLSCMHASPAKPPFSSPVITHVSLARACCCRALTYPRRASGFGLRASSTSSSTSTWRSTSSQRTRCAARLQGGASAPRSSCHGAARTAAAACQRAHTLGCCWACWHIAQDRVTGDLITSHRAIAQRYLCGWFVVDLLATFPVDYIVRAVEVRAGGRGCGCMWQAHALQLHVQLHTLLAPPMAQAVCWVGAASTLVATHTPTLGRARGCARCAATALGPS
jgi:hypothetical protein